MKKIIDAWTKSPKYAAFQEQLSIKKQNLINLKIDIMSDKEESNYTRDELISIVALIKQADAIELDDDNDFDVNSFSIVGTKEEIHLEYIRRIVFFWSFLAPAVIEEDIELACELRDAITIEERCYITSIKKYRQDILDEDKDYIKKILKVSTKVYSKL